MQITQRTQEMVYPAPSVTGQLPHPSLHKLSEVDQRFQGMAVPKLFFFEQGSSQANRRALKESLGEVLGIFYPLAGRLVEREGGGGRMDVKCEDQGAVFCEAWADSPLSYFGAPPDQLQPHPDFSLLIALPRLVFSTPEDALLHVQVTHFICGGLCLCIQVDHILADGAANAHFMELWVDILNGSRSMTLYPYMDLSLLKNECKSTELPSQHSKKSVASNPEDLSSLTYIWKVFHLTPSMIEALRGDGKPISRKPTSFECISAHIWQIVARVQKLAPKEEMQFLYGVNGRERFDPPLPLGYYGNAIFMGHASAKVEDLMNQPLSYAINLIKEASSRVTSDYMKMQLDLYGNQRLIPLVSLSNQRTFVLTTWVKFGLCDLKFPWGKPCCLRTYGPPHFIRDGAFIIPSSLGKGHVDLQVSLKAEHMYTFETLIGKPPLRNT